MIPTIEYIERKFKEYNELEKHSSDFKRLVRNGDTISVSGAK